MYMTMTETHVVCASDDVVFVWCARAPSNWTRTARVERPAREGGRECTVGTRVGAALGRGGVEAAPRLWSPGVVFQRPNGEVLAAACDEAPPPSY